MERVACRQCGHSNDAHAERCAKCGLDLAWALENWDARVSGPEQTHPPVILRVDDEVDALTLTGIILTRAGYRVAKAQDAAEALDLTTRFVPDLIITDDMMPAMRGVEMIPHLKANPVLQGVPVVVLSARYDYETVSAAMEAGATCFIPVPCLPQHLAAIAGSILGGEPLPSLPLYVYDRSTREGHAALPEKALATGEIVVAKRLPSGRSW